MRSRDADIIPAVHESVAEAAMVARSQRCLAHRGLIALADSSLPPAPVETDVRFASRRPAAVLQTDVPVEPSLLGSEAATEAEQRTKAGIQRWLVPVPRSFWLEGSARLAARGSLSLVCPRESNQREGHPGIRADRALPGRYPAVLAAQRPANNSAIPGLGQFAFPRWSAALLGAAQGHDGVGAHPVRDRVVIAHRVRSYIFGAQDARWSGAPMARRAGAGKARRVGARDRAQFAASAGMRCQRTPGACPRSRRAEPAPDSIRGCPETAASGCSSLGLLSLGQAKRSNPLAAGRAEPRVRHNHEKAKNRGETTAFAADGGHRLRLKEYPQLREEAAGGPRA